MNQSHVELPLIPLIIVINDGESDKKIVNLKFCGYPKSSTSDLYEFRVSVFDNGNPEGFLLFMSNFNMNLAVTRIMDTGTKIQYLSIIVHGIALCQFESFSADVESMETINVE